MLDGTSDKVQKNDKKGINWLKESTKNNFVPAIEYKGKFMMVNLQSLL